MRYETGPAYRPLPEQADVAGEMAALAQLWQAYEAAGDPGRFDEGGLAPDSFGETGVPKARCLTVTYIALSGDRHAIDMWYTPDDAEARVGDDTDPFAELDVFEAALASAGPGALELTRGALIAAAKTGRLALGNTLEAAGEGVADVKGRVVTVCRDYAEKRRTQWEAEQAELRVQKQIYDGLENDRLRGSVDHVRMHGVGARVVFPTVQRELWGLRRVGWDVDRVTGFIKPYDPLRDDWGTPADAENGRQTIRSRRRADWG